MFKYFLLGITAGFALGISIAIIFNLSSGPETGGTFPESMSVTYQDEELKQNLGDLSKAVSELTESIRTVRPFSTGQRSLKKERDITARPDPGGNTKALKASTGWAQVLNSSLARALIENGKTPYDPGVSPLLADAAQMLRDAESQLSKANNENRLQLEKGHKELQQQYGHVTNSKDAAWETKVQLRSEIEKKYEDGRKTIYAKYSENKDKILEDFRSALQSLKY